MASAPLPIAAPTSVPKQINDDTAALLDCIQRVHIAVANLNAAKDAVESARKKLADDSAEWAQNHLRLANERLDFKPEPSTNESLISPAIVEDAKTDAIIFAPDIK